MRVRVSSSQHTVFIVIVNYRGLRDTLECLDSLAELSYPSFKTVVVDNGSGDAEVKAIEDHPVNPMLLRNASNAGYAKAANTGILFSLDRGADSVLLLNNDTVVDPNLLAKMVQTAQGPNVGLVQPKVLFYDTPLRVNTIGGLLYLSIGFIRDLGINRADGKRFDKPMYLDWASGCAMLVKREVFRRISVLDGINFPQGGEDYDFSIRARTGGYKIVYCPYAVIYHKVSKTRRTIGANKIGRLDREFGDSRLALLRKHARHPLLAVISYLFIFRPLEALNYIFATPSRRLRGFYAKRFVSTIGSDTFDRVRSSICQT